MLPVRPARESDAAFIIDSWKRSYEPRNVDVDHYRVEMTRTIRRLIGRPDSDTLVAYDPSDDDHLVGFACFTNYGARAELHYIYVKQDFRGKGIARRLLDGVNVTSYTFLSPTARPRKGWRFTPRFTI